MSHLDRYYLPFDSASRIIAHYKVYRHITKIRVLNGVSYFLQMFFFPGKATVQEGILFLGRPVFMKVFVPGKTTVQEGILAQLG